MATDADVFNLIELLLCANELSFINMSLLKAILTSIGRLDLLQELQKAELRISTGIILEDYLKFKSVDGVHQGNNDTRCVRRAQFSGDRYFRLTKTSTIRS